MNSTTYYREIKVENGRRYILCFNPQLFIDQRNARDKSIELFENEIIPELNEELARAQKSRAYVATANKFRKLMAKCKISAFTEVELKPLTINENNREIGSFQGKTRIDSEKKRAVSQMDGFWMLITNLSEKNGEEKFIVSSEDALRPYREKVIIEDAFRDMKSFVEIAPVYVWLENHIKAHYTICVLAYLMNRTITNLLKKNRSELSEDIKTHIGAYKELKECSVDEIYVKNLDQNNYCVTELTKKQKDILQRLGAGGLANVNGLLRKFRENISENDD
jgi:transposase